MLSFCPNRHWSLFFIASNMTFWHSSIILLSNREFRALWQWVYAERGHIHLKCKNVHSLSFWVKMCSIIVPLFWRRRPDVLLFSSCPASRWWERRRREWEAEKTDRGRWLQGSRTGPGQERLWEPNRGDLDHQLSARWRGSRAEEHHRPARPALTDCLSGGHRFYLLIRGTFIDICLFPPCGII